MDIRIESANAGQINSVSSTPAGGQPEVKSATGTPDSKQVSGDTADLGQVSGLVAEAMNQPEVRQDKVDAIKAQIAAGTYEINPSKIADAVINSALNDNL